MDHLRVKNWDHFQHYKDRSPPWIKLHRELLRDYQFSCLQDASKLHLMLIWLLASQLDNQIPNDPAWIQRQLGVSEPVNLKPLIDSGFLVLVQDDSQPLATRQQLAELETEAEAYKEEAETEQHLGPRDEPRSPDETKPDEPDDFDRLWSKRPHRAGNDPKHGARKAYNARMREGCPVADIEAGLERYTRFCEHTGKLNTERVMQFATFLGPSRPWEQPWTLPRRTSSISDANDQAIALAMGEL